MENIRVRFAPSPTGPLHIGGVRTALYNYLFARKNNGKFILRIEDTDQTRYVEGAEDYIVESLKWLGIEPDEGFGKGGDYGPYRQSERKELYQEYAHQLVKDDFAYYAFDTPEELDQWREQKIADGVHSPRYDLSSRMEMKNSLTLAEEEVNNKIAEGTPYVVRIKVPEGEIIGFEDIVRGSVSFRSDELDDKVMLKADGLPTYHLANIIDDHHMQISHVIRGEEWLSSTAHHVLLYRAFGWEEEMPVFAHLPLLLKPTGKGKLSKRDGAKFGFPVFPLNWYDESSGELFAGFREFGFLPDATLNFLALLGWNPGDDQEILNLNALVNLFSLEKIVKSGARFDIDKAKWFNQQYMLNTDNKKIASLVSPLMAEEGINVSDDFLYEMISLMKPRVELLPEFISSSGFFFRAPEQFEEKPIRKKWKPENKAALTKIIGQISEIQPFEKSQLEQVVKSYIEEHQLGFGNILPLLRIGITGTMQGPDIFDTMILIGKEEVLKRLTAAFDIFDDIIEGNKMP
jgi:glutamyl-tRNA synthetase